MQKLHPSEARPSGTKNAPKGTVRGRMPSTPGHKVAGKGTKNASRGTYQASTVKSGGTKVGGHGTRSSASKNTGKAGKY